MGAIFGGAQMSAKSSADVADYEAFCENGDGKTCENAAAEDSEDSDRSVSDSDYHDTMSGDSSDVSSRRLVVTFRRKRTKIKVNLKEILNQ